MRVADFFLLLIMITPLASFSQAGTKNFVVTAKGTVSVDKNDLGRDMIRFSKTEWDTMQQGTKYISSNLPVGASLEFCIEIANKHEFQCRTGVGFECSVFDCGIDANRSARIIDHSNRVCSVRLEWENDHTVKLIFLDEVQWNDL